MIEQKYQADGPLAEQSDNSIYSLDPDLVLVFFPSPGLYVRNTITVPEEFKTYPVTYYEVDGEAVKQYYTFLPAVLKSQYENGQNQSGIYYEEETLWFSPELISALTGSKQPITIVEHHLT